MTTSFLPSGPDPDPRRLSTAVFQGPFRKPYLVLVPMLTFIDVVYLGFHPGVYGRLGFLDWQLTFGRVDGLSKVFAFIMALMAIIGTIYGLHVKDSRQQMAAWFYVAGSLGVIYAATT